jgi:hypothetical protein
MSLMRSGLQGATLLHSRTARCGPLVIGDSIGLFIRRFSSIIPCISRRYLAMLLHLKVYPCPWPSLELLLYEQTLGSVAPSIQATRDSW